MVGGAEWRHCGPDSAEILQGGELDGTLQLRNSSAKGD